MSTSASPEPQGFPQALVPRAWDALRERLHDPIAVREWRTVRTVEVLRCLRYQVISDIRRVHYSFGAGHGRFFSEDLEFVNVAPVLANDIWVAFFAADWLATHVVNVDPSKMPAFVSQVRRTPAVSELEKRVREGGITGKLRAMLTPALALDPRVIAMARLAKPRGEKTAVDSLSYSAAWRHVEGFECIERDWPVLRRPYAGAALRGLLESREEPVRDLKLALRSIGIGDAGWKLLLTANPQCLAAGLPAAANDNVLDVYHWALKVCLADDWVPHPLAMARLAKSNGREPEALVMLEPHRLDGGCWPPFLRALSRRLRRIQSNDELVTFLDGEFEDVYDWLEWEEPDIDANQARAGWDWLVEQRQAWEEREREIALASRHEMHWDVALPAFEYGGYLVVALTDSYELWEEGQAMRHCVRTYADTCAQRDTIIFSIRNGTGGRVATGSLEAEEGAWVVESVRLFSNRQAGEALWEVAQAYAEECQRLAKPVPSENVDFAALVDIQL